MIKFHPSSVGLIMTEPKSKSETLSVGAKTYLVKLAKEFVYGYKTHVTTKYMEKGLACENEAIELINRVRFKSYVKNTERREDEFLTGECDIYEKGVKTIDTKCSWDLNTFPVFEEECDDVLYKYQGVAYMRLWDVPEHEVVYCMLDTPEELRRYEQKELHIVSHIPDELRLTSITYQRDLELEQKLIEKCRAARQFVNNCIERIQIEHGLKYRDWVKEAA